MPTTVTKTPHRSLYDFPAIPLTPYQETYFPYTLHLQRLYVETTEKEEGEEEEDKYVKGKFSVAKLYNQPSANSGEPPLHRYKEFLRENIADQFLCRIMHQHQPHSPKGKFFDWNHYASRLYPLDRDYETLEDARLYGRSMQIHDRDLYTLLNTLTVHDEPPKTEGLVDTMAYNMIIGTGDNMVENMAAYWYHYKETYVIAPYDLACALENEVKHNDFRKVWQQHEVASVVMGTYTISRSDNTACALMETLCKFDQRVHNKFEIDPNYTRMRPIFQRMIEREFDAIAANLPADKRDHSHVLLHVLEEQCNVIDAQRQQARQDTLKNIEKRLMPGLINVYPKVYPDHIAGIRKFITKELDRHETRLIKAVGDFRGHIRAIRETIANQAADPVKTSRKRPGSPLPDERSVKVKWEDVVTKGVITRARSV